MAAVQQQTAADLANRLQDAIINGDAPAAKQLVRQLCQQGQAVRVFPQSGENLLVKVFFRDRENSLEKPRLLQFSTASTLAELKLRLAAQLEIPRQSQCCVVAGQIPPDSTALGDLAHGHEVTVHLYLLSRDQFRQRWGPAQHTDRPAPAVTPPAAGPVGQAKQFAPIQPQPLPAPPVVEKVEPGWNCPTCTFRNNPARPGCEMCGTDRPAGFLEPEEDDDPYEEVN